jgi:hypothetical protein
LVGCTIADFDQSGAFAKCRHTYFKNWTNFQMNTALATTTCQPAGGFQFVDNGDGTVTDNLSTLQWERKDGTVGGGASGTDQDNVNNTYQWSASGTAADGAAFTTFLPYVDGGEPSPSCLGGQCDWRLPTLAELQSIVNDFTCTGAFGGLKCFCGLIPCVLFENSTMQADYYWSATSHARDPSYAWVVYFGLNPSVYLTRQGGFVGVGYKTDGHYVRAVRGGL